MSSEQDLIRARAEAIQARERLLGAAHALQARLKPGALAGDAWESVRDNGEAMAEGAARAAARRPLAASAAALGLAAFIVRRPIARLFKRSRKI